MIRAFIGIALFLLPGIYFHYVYLPNMGISYSLRDGYGMKTPQESDPAHYKPLADASRLTRSELVRGIMSCVERKHPGRVPYKVRLHYADWLAKLGYDKNPSAAKSRKRKFVRAALKETRRNSAKSRELLDIMARMERRKRDYFNCGVRAARPA